MPQSELANPGMDQRTDKPNAGGGRLREFSQRMLRNRLLRNIATVVSGTAGAQALTLAFMPVITRIYGPDNYGVLGVFMGLAMMLIPVAALCYPTSVVLPRRDSDALGLVKLSLLMAGLTSCVLAAFLLIAGDWFAATVSVEAAAPFLLLLPAVTFAGAALETAQQWLFRKQLFRVTAKVSVLYSLMHNSIRSLAGLLSPTAAVLVVTTGFGPALHSLMLLVGIRKGPPLQVKPDVEKREAPTRLRDLAHRYRDFPQFRAPQMLINTVSQNLPTIVLAAYFGPAAAGFFALCKQALTMPTHLIGKSVADVYYPKLARSIDKGEPITGTVMKAVAGLAAVGLIPFALVFAIGPWMFATVFGDEWRSAGEFARWLALGEYVVFMSRPCTVAIPALGLQRLSLIFEICSTTLRVAALFFGAAVLNEQIGTVMAFSAASIVIYFALILVVFIQARKWHANLRKVDRVA
ncbi:Membrane protein involved in the export of O-antigen and teichoic acid [Halopseudomonas xinjiangensis]|uniref:Membrane protein involved in the export of O-antigen and teichoic acid n=1 Tax=Halopseudomonas xinjiangensis TaxID=487184 RepID=A0A1H1WEV0_9GAMM|nr:oligosaccharide flippase family protein [Halopseudomonas xinjiangensis]SDS95161.1 Membrane protein involved in the export of O-antigen and teichoic acid [Halopseudomonas xinjiangensis]